MTRPKHVPPKTKNGRPNQYSIEKIKRVADRMLRYRQSRTRAGILEGIAPSTLARWLQRYPEARQMIDDALEMQLLKTRSTMPHQDFRLWVDCRERALGILKQGKPEEWKPAQSSVNFIAQNFYDRVVLDRQLSSNK